MTEQPEKKRWALPAVDPSKRRKVIPQAEGAATGAYCKSCQPAAHNPPTGLEQLTNPDRAEAMDELYRYRA